MEYRQCHAVLEVVGEGLVAPRSSTTMLEATARALVEHFELKSCQFRLLSQDQKLLEHEAAWGLSERFLGKGPVHADRSTTDALAGQIVAIADCSTDPRIEYPDDWTEEGIASLLTVPLSARGQVLGVMRLGSAQSRTFTDTETGFFSLIATYCSGAIVRAMFQDILEHVTAAIQSTLELDQVLNTIVEVVTGDLRARGAAIRLCDAKSGVLELRAKFGLSAGYLATVSSDPGPAVRTVLGGEPVAILDATTDPRIKHKDHVRDEMVSSILYIPLTVRSKVIGVLSLYTNNPYEFSEDEITLMQSIGEQCALAIRNAQMYAALKLRYENMVDDFQQWFEHYNTGPKV